MNRDEIMLWLNDRLGRPVTVTLYLERHGIPEDLFSAAGTLRHWSEDNPEVVEAAAGLEGGLDELSARYYIDDHGDTTLDLTGYEDVSGHLHPNHPERLTITLSAGFALTVQFPAPADTEAVADLTRRLEQK